MLCSILSVVKKLRAMDMDECVSCSIKKGMAGAAARCMFNPDV
jgi:hypothetical protein